MFQLLLDKLSLPPYSEATKDKHVKCLEVVFNEYDEEMVKCFLYCRENIAPVLAIPAGSVFQEGFISVCAALACSYFVDTCADGIDPITAARMLAGVNTRIADLFHNTAYASYTDEQCAGLRIREVSTCSLRSREQGLMSYLFSTYAPLNLATKGVIKALHLPTEKYDEHFSNFLLVRGAQHIMMITDPECIANKLLLHDNQCMAYLQAVPETNLSGKIHCTYEKP